MKADILIESDSIFDSVSDVPFEGFVAIKKPDLNDRIPGQNRRNTRRKYQGHLL